MSDLVGGNAMDGRNRQSAAVPRIAHPTPMRQRSSRAVGPHTCRSERLNASMTRTRANVRNEMARGRARRAARHPAPLDPVAQRRDELERRRRAGRCRRAHAKLSKLMPGQAASRLRRGRLHLLPQSRCARGRPRSGESYLVNPAGIVMLVTISAEADSVGLVAMELGLPALVLGLEVVVFSLGKACERPHRCKPDARD